MMFTRWLGWRRYCSSCDMNLDGSYREPVNYGDKKGGYSWISGWIGCMVMVPGALKATQVFDL